MKDERVEDFQELGSPKDVVDLRTFQIPEEFSMKQTLDAVTGQNSPGYLKLKGLFSEKDITLAKERVMHYTKTDHYLNMIKSDNEGAVHNNYKGLTWALLNKGEIFEKIVQHPLLYNISSNILGHNAQISSFSANSVLPGMEGQKPHLDYPYYESVIPNLKSIKGQTLTLTFLIMLTDFTLENGATAVRSGSHVNPSHPKDADEFFAHADQLTGSAGDVVVFSGALQHCAMPNKSNMVRSAIIMQMATAYIKTFEDITNLTEDNVKSRATPALRRLLALDHVFPLTNLV